MKLYRPCKSSLITQGFGPENTKPEMLSAYQQIGLLAHNGLDIACADGDDIRFNGTGKGMVTELSTDPKAGLGVVVFFKEDDKYYKTTYWHLKKISVVIGQEVESADLLGLADNTGWSTGTHLHFGLKECDREGVTLNKDNGYNGAINYEPYYENYYILDLKKQMGQMVVFLQRVIELLKQLLWKK